jgi:8-oxo-dGTP diphosphatase
MRGDGDGWVVCRRGHRHWGRHGAAGLLLRYVDAQGGRWILLQHRAEWSHHGGTWGLPGGARDSHESVEEAALREAAEEVRLDLSLVRVVSSYADDHGGWSYVTSIAHCDKQLDAEPAGAESADVRWVSEADLPSLPLHPGLAASWPRLRST